MGRWYLALAASLLIAGPVRADGEEAIPSVIQSQIEAFLADDFETAFTFASPGIRRMFGTPDRFGSMVRQGYPMVWRPADVRYLDQRSAGGYQFQKVLITDRSGVAHVLEYQMIETDGGWQIAGVRILRDPGLGV